MKREKLGFRDEALSERHRKWGFDLPMVDIDFLCVEYTQGKARALVDYKYRVTSEPSQYSKWALQDLAAGRRLPLWVATYWRDPWRFQVTPLNPEANPYMGEYTESEYVSLLHSVRRGERS